MEIVHTQFLTDVQSCSILGVGNNSRVYEHNGNAVKVFNDYCDKSYSFCERKKNKLEILQRLQLPYYIRVLKLYGILDENGKNRFCCYKMPILKSNLLRNFNKNIETIRTKNEILEKILKLIIKSNQEKIFNYDLQLSNFHLDASGQLTGFDVDNLMVDQIASEQYLKTMIRFREKMNLKQKKNCYILQNIAFLVGCLNLWLDENVLTLDIDSLVYLVDTLDVEKHVKDIMISILEGDISVDLQELLKSTSSENIYIYNSYESQDCIKRSYVKQ